MTFKEIKTRYEATKGVPAISVEKLAGWIDAAQKEIAKRHGQVVKLEVDATANVPVDLPDDYLGTAEVYKDGYEYRHYRINEMGQITFPVSAEFVIHYSKFPDPIDYTDDGAEPEVHRVFHEAILSYCLYRYWDEEAEGVAEDLQTAQRYFADFARQVDEGAFILALRVHRPESIEVEGWW